jgi:hypothetical protein
VSRFVAIAAAISLVVCGAVIGGLGTYLVLERPGRHDGFRPPPPPRPPAPFTREMESRLDLTEDQREKIHEILGKGRDEADSIRRELRPRLESELAATRTSIAAVLTPEQKAKFEEMVQQDRRRAERFFMEGPPGPPEDGPPR